VGWRGVEGGGVGGCVGGGGWGAQNIGGNTSSGERKLRISLHGEKTSALAPGKRIGRIKLKPEGAGPALLERGEKRGKKEPSSSRMSHLQAKEGFGEEMFIGEESSYHFVRRKKKGSVKDTVSGEGKVRRAFLEKGRATR